MQRRVACTNVADGVTTAYVMRVYAHACKQRKKQGNIQEGKDKLRKREAINTMVDIELKRLFEATRPIHNLSFGELLDQAIREKLITLNQTSIIDQEIVRKEAEISKISQEQTQLRTLKEQIRDLKIPFLEEKNNGNSAELESQRSEMFEKSKESILKLWNKGDINWDSVVPKFRFNDRKEAQEWFRQKIEEEV